MKPSNSTFRRLGSWAILNSNGAAKIKPKLGELLKSLEAKKQDGVLQHQIPILQVQPSEALSSPQFSKIRFKFRQTVVMIMMMMMIKMMMRIISLKPYQWVITPAMMMTRTTKDVIMLMVMMPMMLMTMIVMVVIMLMVIRFKFERPVVKAGRKPHQCLTDDCPCYKCSGCTKKWTKRCPFFMF